MDALQHGSGLGVTRARKGVSVQAREVEIGLLKRETHGAQKRQRRMRRSNNGGDVLPKIVGQGQSAEDGAVGIEAGEVQATVLLLFGERDHQAALERRRQLREREQRPCEERPEAVQTGPALRHDMITLEKHLRLLETHKKLKYIYLKLTDSIMNR